MEATGALTQVLIDKVFTALLNQAQFAIDCRDQFEALTTKLELTKTFLSSTDDLKSRDKDVQKVLPTIRKLIYEADDVLTDCQVRDEYRKEGSFCNFSPRERLFSYKTGKKLDHINKQIEKLETSMGVYWRPRQPINEGNSAYQVRGYASQDYDPSDVIGLENEIKKIKEWLFSGDEVLNRVGVVGMGGLGKTTIARKIYNDREVGARFEKRIWLAVSRDFSEDPIMRAMLKQLGKDSSRLERSQWLRQIHDLLGGKTCLIVMDDVWKMNVDWWNKLFATSGGSFVIITSRDVEVTRSMGVDISRIHRPKTLDQKESWTLFSKFAFPLTKGKCPSQHLERVGGEILEKCGGLPLAIKTVGALLAQKTHSPTEWKQINDNFHELTTEGRNSTAVMASLQLSYDELPSLLKQCLLCFSIYPEDCEIISEQIVHWWVGEGLIQGQDTSSAIELGFGFLSQLVSRCLVEVVHRRGFDGRVYTCKMHDLVRDMIMKIAKDEAFCYFEHGKQKLTKDSRWLHLTSDADTVSLKTSPKLRTLLLISSDLPLGRNFDLLNSLRVLNFSNNKLDDIAVEYLWSWICSLKRLACLNLSGVSGLKEVPSSIQKLRNLQILVLRKCNDLAKLNPSITYLKKLIVLNLGYCSLKFLPAGLEKLVYLQELSGFRLVSRANTQSCRLADLRNLKQLKVLRMSLNSESEISVDERDVLTQLDKLTVLAIDAEDSRDTRVSEMLDHLSPPAGLKELYLRRYRHETPPKWVNPKELSNLQYLCLEDGDIIRFEISSESEDGSVSKWIIEGLCLKVMPKLDLDWEILQRDLPYFYYAEISRCFNLKKYPYPFDKPVIWRKNQDWEIIEGHKDEKGPSTSEQTPGIAELK